MTKKVYIEIMASFVLIAALLLVGASDASAKHPAIDLVDSEGEYINPITGENADKPFSTYWTCGTCHDYEEITKGYHFQMGWEEISDTFGVSAGEPYSLSNGFMGRWYPYAYRQLAKKENEHPDEIDLTVYDFVGFSEGSYGTLTCGACHPGGGGLEYDRNGDRYDETLADNPELRDELDGDYYQSNWDKSGVVEADCFICHLEGYNFDARAEQLKEGNYKWAVVAGSRIGLVEGSVEDGDEPTVTYNTRFFNADGTITIDVEWPPPSENCVFCHGRADVKKRGFSWEDIHNPDIHNAQGLSCSACHPSGLDHQFVKGDPNVSTIAGDLDGSMRDCEECHMQGYLGASVPEHKSVRPSHLERIACEACHIPSLGRAASLAMETSTGKVEFITNPRSADDPGDRAEWKPVYERRSEEVIFPLNSVVSIWWGNRDADSIIYPLFLRETEDAWNGYEDDVTDDDDDGEPEVNRIEEIAAGLKATRDALAGNARFDRIDPVLVKGRKIYSLNQAGEVQETENTDAWSYVNFSINHNVAPARMALGANGCDDCHVQEANFFKGQRVLDPLGENNEPVTLANGRFFGCKPISFAINSFHQEILSPLVSIGMILLVFLVTVHYHSYGPKRLQFVPYSGEVQRFTLIERGIHLFRLISFVILTVTGLILAFNASNWLDLLFKSPEQMLDIHIWAGIVFIITTVLGIVVWFKDAIFAAYDKAWVKIIGGYLGYKGEVPAGRFNAGQKMFYWYTTIFGLIMSITGVILIFRYSFGLSTICIMSTIHNFFGFVLIAGVLAHAYLGTVANPGTWRVLVDGYVTEEWAKHHHPFWYNQVVKDGPSSADEQETEETGPEDEDDEKRE